MILPNIQKFVYSEDKTTNFRKLSQACCTAQEGESECVVFCPKFGNIFAWWLPTTSPNSVEGGWSKLKHIEDRKDSHVSLWDSTIAASLDIREMVSEHYDCYLVPMNDIHYSTYESDGVNFKLFIKHDDTFYSTNITDKPDNFMVKSVCTNVFKPDAHVEAIYSLWTNEMVYNTPSQGLDAWTTVDNELDTNELDTNELNSNDYFVDTTPDYNLWSHPNSVIHPDYSMNTWNDIPSGVRLDLPLEPETPKNPPKENLLKKFNEEAVDHVQEYSSGSDIELTSGSDEETDYEEWEETDDEPVNIAEGIMVDGDDDEEDEEDTSDEDYEPSISTIDENHDEDYYDEDYDEYEEYDEMRQDLDGSWYTRRQFYDWYGSDEAWDNLDPEIYHRKRYDENCDQWLTKEEMFQWYGTNIVWKKMNPKKQFKRRRICDAYSWASYLPQNLQCSFIHDYMKTY